LFQAEYKFYKQLSESLENQADASTV